MAIAQGPRVQLCRIRESVAGTTPSGAMKIVRAISRNINAKKNTVQSQEVWADRNIHDVRHGFTRSEATIGMEYGIDAVDDFMESCFGALWATNVLKIGTSLITDTVERQFLDVNKFEAHKGVNTNMMEFRVQPETIIGCTATLIGLQPATPANVTAATVGTPTAAAANQPFASFDGAITIGGVPIAVVTGLNWTVNAQRTLSPVVGSKYSPTIFEGQCVVTGTLSAYFEDHALLNAFLNETTAAVQMTLNDIGGAMSHAWLFPKVKYTGNDKDPPANGGVVQDIPFQALYDSVTQTSVQVTRDNTP